MKLSKLLEGVQYIQIYNNKECEITGIGYNSQKIEQGNLFVAITGFSTDGHKYIPSAVENGAVAVICEKHIPDVNCTQIVVENSRIAEAIVSANFFKNPAKSFRLIGITGTNGKTTCTYLVKHILEKSGYKVGLIGTNQNMIGNTVFETGRTTPDSFELCQLFRKMADANVDYVVMEVSSHAIELHRIYGLDFYVGAFTNLTQDHLDFHITMENYAGAKQKLFSMTHSAVINADDKYGENYLKNCKCKAVGYGSKNQCELMAQNIKYSDDGVEFILKGHKYSLAIPGEFSVYNALCAIGVCLECQLSEDAISDALKCANGVKGRAEVVPVNRDYTVMIDYAHTPDGIQNILSTVKGFAKGRVIILFGCGGNRDTTKRPIMGKIAGELADYCIITSDNPRKENPAEIIAMIEPGVKQTGTPYTVVPDRYDAIKFALGMAQKGDVVILAGKGHETYQELADGKIHFDEREVVEKLLKEM